MKIAIVTGYMKPQHGKGLPDLTRWMKQTQPQHTVQQFRWNQWDEIAEFNPQLSIGHSYGVSTLLFLAARGMVIRTLVSCDGIWRKKLDAPSPTSFKNSHRLWVSRNVKILYSFQQNVGWLQGHDFIFEDWLTTLWSYSEDDVKGFGHWNMDRYPGFLNLVETLV